MQVMVTGGAGFIGSAVVRYLINETGHEVVNIDKLTYAGNLESLNDVASSPRYRFEHADICDGPRLEKLFDTYKPDVVMHLAAESHVDRSIDGPAEFVQTNIVGTYTLLEITRRYLQNVDRHKRDAFRFHRGVVEQLHRRGANQLQGGLA